MWFALQPSANIFFSYHVLESGYVPQGYLESEIRSLINL